MKMSVVLATVEVYRAICEQMLPTPARLHYTFNLRDPSKVKTITLTSLIPHPNILVQERAAPCVLSLSHLS